MAHPDESPAEVVETAQILAEDPTGDLRDCTADGAAPAPGPEAA